MFFLIWKMAKISLFKGPPLWFGARNPDFLISGAKPKRRDPDFLISGAKPKVGTFEKWNFGNFSKKEKHEKSGNFRNRDFATIPQSHNPTIPEFFSPAATAHRAPGSRKIWRNQRGGPLKSRIIAIFQRRKSTENPEISEIAISLES